MLSDTRRVPSTRMLILYRTGVSPAASKRMRSVGLRRFAGKARSIAIAAAFSLDPFSVQYRRVCCFPHFCRPPLFLWRFWYLTEQGDALSWCLCFGGLLYVAIVCVLSVPTSGFGMKWAVWVLAKNCQCLRSTGLLKWFCESVRLYEKCFRLWKKCLRRWKRW